jgi:tetratricopeptide (TPR) repeat protein
MYETETYADCVSIAGAAFSVSSKHSLSRTSHHAAIINIQGLIKVDLGNPKQALIHFQEGLRLREATLGQDEWGTGVSISNVGLAYMEMGETELAMKWATRALEFRQRIKCRMLDNSLANLAALLIRMGKPEEAEEMYRRVPGLEQFTDDDLLRDDKPRYAR